MGNRRLAQQQLTDDLFPVDGISDCLPHQHIIKRAGLNVEIQVYDICPGELLDLKSWLFAQRNKRIGREVCGQRRKVDSSTVQLRLKSVCVLDWSDPDRFDRRGALPIILVRFQVDNTLGLVETYKAKRAGANRVI